MGSRTEKVGSPDDAVNLNPYTQRQANFLTQLQQSVLPQLQANTPEAMISRTLGLQPQFQGLLDFQMGDFADARRRAALSQIGSQATALGGQFAGMGALHSGAFAGALGETIGQGLLSAEADILAQRAGLAQGLTGAGLGLMGQQYQGQLGLLNAAMGNMTGLSQQEWWQPTYVQQPGFGQMLFGALTGMGTAAVGSMFGGGGLLGKDISPKVTVNV